MNRNQFINELRKRLMTLPLDEREKAISYYEEFFDDAGPENEDSVIYELGDIDRIAREIIENSSSNVSFISTNKYTVGNDSSCDEKSYKTRTEYSDSTGHYNKTESENTTNYYKEEIKKEKQKIKPIWIILIIIGVLACFPMIMMLLGLSIGFIGIIIGVIATAFGLVVSGIASVVTIPFAGFAVIGVILYYLGKGLLSIALLLILAIVIIKLIRAVVDYFSNRTK